MAFGRASTHDVAANSGSPPAKSPVGAVDDVHKTFCEIVFTLL
jgi:hypothetical protein